MEGKSYATIAADAGASHEGVRLKCLRAERALKRRLIEAGLGAEEGGVR
jgi:hypothetical protein